MTPLVSVVTATRNRPELLRRALLSIREQSLDAFEVIVVDDGSTPETQDAYREIWQELDDRFTLHLAGPAGGPGSDPGRTRNVGAGLAHAEIIAFLDHDDVWIRQDHLATGLEALQQSGAGYYFTHVRFEPEQPGLMWAVEPARLVGRNRTLANGVVQVPVSDFVRVMRHSHIHPSHSIVRSAVWKKACGFIEGLKTADDVNFMLRIADLDPGILYRPEASVAIRMPDGKSYSLASSLSSQLLSEVQATMDIRARSQSPIVRRCARSRQAWALRQLSAHARESGSTESYRLALDAFLTYPTLGGAWWIVKSSVNGWM